MKQLIVLAGASGVGKSTIQRRISHKVEIIRRVTTRKHQDQEEWKEIISVQLNLFMQWEDEGKIIASYERYGHRYAVYRPDLEKVNDSNIGVIAYRAVEVEKLRQSLDDTWKIYVCWLKADDSVIMGRLQSRKDHETISTLSQRAQHQAGDLSQYADKIIDANENKKRVVESFLSWVDSIS